MRRSLLLLVVLVLLLAGCGLQKGYVYHKGYAPAYTTIETGQHCYTGPGGKQTCYPYVYPVYEPAQWWLDIQSCSTHEQRTSDCQTGTVDVDEATWDKTNVGDYVNFGG